MWLTHPLHCVSSGLCLHGRLSQLLGQLPHAVLHPLQEDLPQHHAGLGKDVLSGLFPRPLLQAHFQVDAPQLAPIGYRHCASATKCPRMSVSS